MERIYKQINQACDTDPATLEAARQELVKLQAGDPENLAIWREMIALSESQFERIYRRLKVKFDFTLGESFYNARLKSVVEALAQRGIARLSEGAMVRLLRGPSRAEGPSRDGAKERWRIQLRDNGPSPRCNTGGKAARGAGRRTRLFT